MEKLNKFVDYCIQHLDFSIQPPYGYRSAPICALDSVFSIGVKYTSVCNVLTRFCNGLGLEFNGQGREVAVSTTITTSDLLKKIDAKNIDANILAKDYTNKQRTSTKSGILKADAYLQFLKVMKKHEVETVKDIHKICGNLSFEQDIKSITGLASGITLDYLYILAGIDDYVKVDRHITRFCQAATMTNDLTKGCIVSIIREGASILSKELDYKITARHLDHIIWEYKSKQ